MGVQKKTRKFAQVKRAISLRDSRLFVFSSFSTRHTLTWTAGRRTRQRMTRKTMRRKMILLEKCMYTYIFTEKYSEAYLIEFYCTGPRSLLLFFSNTIPHLRRLIQSSSIPISYLIPSSTNSKSFHP